MSGRALLVALAVGLLACGGLGQRPAWELPPPAPRDAPVVPSERLHRSELPGGLKALVLEDPRLPLVELSLTLRRGAGAVAPEQAGLADFTTELMERGAGARDALELAAVIDGLGASLSVASDWDSTAVYVSGLARDLEQLFEVLADVALRPRFDHGEAAKVRAEQLASLESAKDNPRSLAFDAFAAALYGDHRYGLPGAGSPESVARLGPEDARAFHAAVFRPGNAIFAASGDVETRSILDLLGRYFGAWPSGPAPAPGPAPPSRAPAERKVVIVDRPELGQARIVIGHDGIARTDAKRIEAALMNLSLGASGFSSRLMGRIRAEEGLTYGVSSFFAMRRHPGPFGVATFTRVPEARRVVDMVLEELERIASEPPSPREVADAQSLSTGRFALGLETSSSVAGALVDLDVYGLPEDSLDTYRGRVRRITPEDVAEAARQRIRPEDVAIVLVGPAEALRPQLEGLGPVQVVVP